MWKFLAFIQKKLVWAIPIMMVAGIIAGYYFDMSYAKKTIIPLTILMIFPMMVNLQLEKILNISDIKIQSATQLYNFTIMPFTGYFLGKLFFPESSMIILGFLFIGLIPTSGMTISWTGFAKGNINAAVKMTVIGLLLGSIATPIYAKLIMGKTIAMPMQKIFFSIALVVFIPLILGFITKKLIIKFYGMEEYQKNIKQKFPKITTLGVLGIVFVVMSLKAKSITSNPIILLKYMVPIVLFYLINFSLTTLIGKFFFERKDAIALIYGTVMRNLSIVLAIIMSVFSTQGTEIAIIISMAYVVQILSAAWYVKLTPKIFGPV